MQRDANFALLLLCFFLSGLAGLVYETAWTREFTFVFGASNLAVATVLAAYMAGLAAGAAVAARFAHRVRRPVLVYGLLELAIGLAALAVPWGIEAARAAYVALFGGQTDLPDVGGLATAVFYAACSFAILLLPTGMMGATLPLLARHAVKREAEIGPRIGLLYAVNTAGAVAGTLLAAFLFLPELGLRRTIWLAAAINGAVFVAAAALARSSRSAPAPEPGDRARGEVRGDRWILALLGVSGVISFTYEILWVRLLDHVLGGSVYAFATMLATFLLGIALGSAVASRWATTRDRGLAGFAVAQIGISLFALAAFAAAGEIPALGTALRDAGLPKQLVDTAAAMSTLFPAALCIGATYPFAVRALARDERDAGSASARGYAANTLGSIVGSVAAGFLVVPALGFAGTAIVCALGNLVLAAVAAWRVPRWRTPLVAVSVGIALLLAVFRPGTPWPLLLYLSFGERSAQDGQVAYLGVGRAATVTLLASLGRWSLRTNGNPEGYIDSPPMWHNRSLLEPWLTALPVLARPEAESLLVVGFGAGRALETVPASVGRVDVVEIEPEVIAANRVVAGPRWRDPLADPRVHIHLNDARNALLLTRRRFDIIVSQPSHPWSAGASHLYTREFFALAKSRLRGDGVYLQWIGLPFVDELLFRALLATLGDVFANVRVYNPAPRGGVLFIASDGPLDVESTAARAIAQAPEDFERLAILTPEDVIAWWLLDESGARALGKGAPIIRDGHNLMQSRAPRILDDPIGPRVLDLVAPHDPIPGIDTARFDPLYLIQRLPPLLGDRLAEALTDPVTRRAALGIGRQRAGDRAGARAALTEVLRDAPRHPATRAAMLRLDREAIRRGANAAATVVPPLDATEAAVVAGWRTLAAAGPVALAALEPALAAAGPLHPLHEEASRLRARWRIASGNAERAREAMAIADQRIWARARPGDLLLRAEAAVAARESFAAVEALMLLAPTLNDGAWGRAARRRALQILNQLPRDPALAGVRREVARLLRGAPAR